MIEDSPIATTSNVAFPAGPTYAELLGGSNDGISWVRYKVWAADWYVAALQSLIRDLPNFDRHVGIEMALDGALGAISGAFDSAVALLLVEVESVLQLEKPTPSHQYNWKIVQKRVAAHGELASDEMAQLVHDIDIALLETKDRVPEGWLAHIRRLRNRAVHQHSLPRTWDLDDQSGQLSPQLTGLSLAALMTACDDISDLTERMLDQANGLGWVGDRVPLRRTRWAGNGDSSASSASP